MIETLLAQPGRIIHLGFVIQCRECGVTCTIPSSHNPARAFRRHGWEALDRGWTCRKCRRKEREGASV